MSDCVRISLPIEQIRGYCAQRPIRRLSMFGSALRDDFGSNSDLDLLVEYIPGIPVTLLDMAQQEIELAQIVGRRIDLRTPNELSPYFRQHVIDTAQVLYERAG
jgi:predicted nucleotidyltransferase